MKVHKATPLLCCFTLTVTLGALIKKLGALLHPDPIVGLLPGGIHCERFDARSFARSLVLLNNIMLRQRPGQSVTEHMHFMRQSFEDYNEAC
jgi:hypothetical protein